MSSVQQSPLPQTGRSLRTGVTTEVNVPRLSYSLGVPRPCSPRVPRKSLGVGQASIPLHTRPSVLPLKSAPSAHACWPGTPVRTGPRSAHRPPRNRSLPGQALRCLQYKALASEHSTQGPPVCFPPTSPLNACRFLPLRLGANNDKLGLVPHPCHVVACPSDLARAVPMPCLPHRLCWLSPTQPLRCCSCLIFSRRPPSSTEHSSSPDSVPLYTCINICLCISPERTLRARVASDKTHDNIART